MVRICIIGCGPSGLSFLYHHAKLAKEGRPMPEVVCYDKQKTWCGLWNYTWRTGLDEYGECVHGSMYRYLWSNGPKEASLEFPDYTFDKHFGKPIPSFPPREVIYNYLEGRFSQYDIKSKIKFEHLVRNVEFDKESKVFRVSVKDLKGNRVLDEQTFDFVINCSGHFSVPNVPQFPGIERFPGRVMHSHDFRDAMEFQGKDVLVIGSSYSAEDLALQMIKYGANSVICSYRTAPMGFKWPNGITERPLLTKVEGNLAFFKDGSSKKVDAIIMATGYLHYYPYFDDTLRLTGANIMYPDNLYKGTLWMKGGEGKLFYIGAQDQYYTFTMFDAQAFWALKAVLGDIKLPSRVDMEKDIKTWLEKQSQIKDCHDDINFQRDFVQDLVDEAGYGFNLDVADLFHEWERHKEEDITGYRDKQFKSIFTGKLTPSHHTPFFQALDDSMECFQKTSGS